MATVVERPEEVRARFGPLIGRSAAMQAVYDLIDRLADTTLPVLVQGETGTGKGLVARAIHDRSSRRRRPFLHQNCGALPPGLLESELFGHARGAFTGAVVQRKGLFEAADGGTVFLDEIGEAPSGLQVRLLNVLEEGGVKRVGENRTQQVDVRIVAATNRDLEADVRAGRFREDLFFRLCVLPLFVPPLRDRTEDTLLLAEHFLDLCRESGKKGILGFAAETMRAFTRYGWPGNVRELENEVRRASALVEAGGEIRPEHLSERIAEAVGATWRRGIPGPLKTTVQAFERRAIRKALDHCGWNVTRTAQSLGLTRVGLQGKMRRLGIRRMGSDGSGRRSLGPSTCEPRVSSGS